MNLDSMIYKVFTIATIIVLINFTQILKKSSTYLGSSINNHFWYGLLSTMNYQLNENIEISGGLDLRSYKGEHYREIYDLLGGDYVIDESNNIQSNQIKYHRRYCWIP